MAAHRPRWRVDDLAEAVQRQILTTLDLEPSQGRDTEGSRDDVGWNARGLDVVRVNVTQAQAGHETVEDAPACSDERPADAAGEQLLTLVPE